MRALVLVICGILLYGCISAKQDSFAKCLTAKGVKMYGAYWCPHCQDQKASFGDSWKYVSYVECANDPDGQSMACNNAGISQYPTWDFGNGSRKTGELSLQEISAISGCEMNES